ncbi:MAG: helix-turn-helix domain-containing protein [Paenibacillaceae bacterium]|nr:helix-turn-helix domain-containing protein [Paenibacillaceae bacterium]
MLAVLSISRVSRLFRHVRSRAISRILLLFVVGMSVPVIMAGIFVVRGSSQHIERQLSQTNQLILEEKRRLLEQQMNEVNNAVSQLFSSDPLWTLMNAERIDAPHTLLMAAVTKQFKATIDAYPAIDSIVMFDSKHDFVLADAKYAKEAYPDPSLFAIDFGDRRAATYARTLGNKQVVTYAQQYVLPSVKNTVVMAVNLNSSLFFRELEAYDIAAIGADGAVLFAGTIERALLQSAALRSDLASGAPASGVMEAQGVKYAVNSTHSGELGWNLVRLQSYNQMIQPAKLLKETLFLSFAVVLGLSLLLAIVFSRVIYTPLRRLLHNIRSGMDSGRIPVSANEYQWIDKAFHFLHHERSELTAKYNIAFPYFKEHSLADMMSGASFDPQTFLDVLRVLEVDFPWPHFAAVVFDVENAALGDAQQAQVERALQQEHESAALKAVSSRIDTRRGFMIVNTERDIHGVYAALTLMKERLEAEGVSVTVALGPMFDDWNGLAASYRAAQHLLNGKFFIGINEIIHQPVSRGESPGAFHDYRQAADLLDAIRAQNEADAAAALDALFERIATHLYTTEHVKYVCYQVGTQVLALLQELGADFASSSLTGETMFAAIHRAETIFDLKRYMHDLTQESVRLAAALKSRAHSMLVTKAIDFIGQHYKRDLSLDEIAASVFLSPRYLSAIFKHDTGLTVFDYITKLRMETATHYLVSTQMKIQDIAAAVGYNTVQSFLRFFKMNFGMTPLEFRRLKGLNGGGDSQP